MATATPRDEPNTLCGCVPSLALNVDTMNVTIALFLVSVVVGVVVCSVSCDGSSSSGKKAANFSDAEYELHGKAKEAALNPGETCEVPAKEGEPNRCLILDDYRKDGTSFEIDGKKYCLLLCLEVFRSEMEHAMKHGSASVLKRLKEKGYYPYSDLDREPVY